MRTLLTSFVLLLTISGYSQKVTILKATSQSWSGGLAGHHGINYHITLQCADTTIMPDTVWIAGRYYPINIAKGDTVSRKVDHKHNTVTCNIAAYSAWNDMDIMNRMKEQSKIKTKQPTPKNYDGAALINYMYKRKQYSILVKAFTVLPEQDYP